MADADINFGLWVGAERRAGRAEVEAETNGILAEKWEKTAKKVKGSLDVTAAEADAGLAVVDAIMKEIAEIDKNPEKARFFSDPENRLSRTNLFKKVKEEKRKLYSDTEFSSMPGERIK
ncbi:hypothetical protein [Methyloversatilis discipulorum]|uniref:hypothetical protein n=1 Tax=Methyloversatilis discipulorum TaxID=1119528 RepID=UPI003137F9F2